MLRQRAYQILEHGRRREPASRAVDWLLVVLVLANVAANVPLCREHFRLILLVDRFPATKPGQFIQISCREVGEQIVGDDDGHGEEGSRPLAEAHLKVQQRLEQEVVESHARSRLDGSVPRKEVAGHLWAEDPGCERRRHGVDAVEYHRGAVGRSAEDEAGEGSVLETAHGRQDAQRIARIGAVQVDGMRDDLGLQRERGVVGVLTQSALRFPEQ